LYAYHNFGKREANLTILLLLLPRMNCRKSWPEINHLTANLLPHYLAKIERSTAQLYSALRNATATQHRLFIA